MDMIHAPSANGAIRELSVMSPELLLEFFRYFAVIPLNGWNAHADAGQ